MPCEGCDPWVRTIRGAWLESAWWSVGRYGHWHSHLYPRFRPAIGHVHVNTLDGTSDTKNLILKLADLYDWKLAARWACWCVGGVERWGGGGAFAGGRRWWR